MARVVSTADAVEAERRAHDQRARASDAAVLLHDLPELLRFERQRRGLTMRQLARVIGVDHSHIGNIETGRYTASVPLAIKILEWLAS